MFKLDAKSVEWPKLYFFSRKKILCWWMETAINFSETATCALFCFTFYCWYMGALPASNTLARTHTRTQLVGGKVKIFNTSHSEHMKSLAMLKLLMSVPNTRVNTRDLLCSMPCSAFVCLQIEYDMYFSIWSYISNSSFFFIPSSSSLHSDELFVRCWMCSFNCSYKLEVANVCFML